jgi:hypothetical protein
LSGLTKFGVEPLPVVATEKDHTGEEKLFPSDV